MWKQLQPATLTLMRSRLGTDFQSFALECERLGLLANNFIPLSNQQLLQADPNTLCAFCASAVVSAANHFGGQGDLAQAQLLAQWALRLEPDHVAACGCMIAIAQTRGDGTAHAHYSDLQRQIIMRLRLIPAESMNAFQVGVLRALKLASGQ